MERIYSQGPYDVTQSLGYQQAGQEGKRRMARLASMGLPMQSDINKVRIESINPTSGRPIYSAAPHQSWGTWGALSGPTEKDGTPIVGGYGKDSWDRPSNSFSKSSGWNTIPSIPFRGSFY